MDNLIVRLAAAAALTFALACASDDPDNRVIACGIDDGLLPSDYGEANFKADVYFVNEKGTLWSNGEMVKTGLDDATSVFVSDGDVYVAGMRKEPMIWQSTTIGHRNVAAVWKNGAISSIGLDSLEDDDVATGSHALSVFVADGNAYVAGYQYNRERGTMAAVLWVNGAATRLSEAKPFGQSPVSARSVYVSNGTVYVAGEAGNNAVLWVNGEASVLGPGCARSVCISGGDVYVAGLLYGDSVIWKNGMARNLVGNGQYSNVVSVSASGGDVYAAGNDGLYAILWVNGGARRLSNGKTNEWATAAVESGGNVYAVGYANVWWLKSRLWLDGKPIDIPNVGPIRSLFVAERVANRQ